MTEHYWVKLYTTDPHYSYTLKDPIGHIIEDPDRNYVHVHDYITLAKAVMNCDYIMGSGTPYPVIVFTKHITAAKFAPAPEGSE